MPYQRDDECNGYTQNEKRQGKSEHANVNRDRPEEHEFDDYAVEKA